MQLAARSCGYLEVMVPPPVEKLSALICNLDRAGLVGFAEGEFGTPVIEPKKIKIELVLYSIIT